MDYESIIKNYTEEKKENVVSLAELNKDRMHNDNEYHPAALNTFFNLWKEHFPNVSQSKTCRGCRKSVCQFFHNVADFISSEKLKPAETVDVIVPVKSAKKKAKKVKKVEKHKTITGALSPTGARN
tara:strand:+ start:418 stop:795 length:378 start_codon:yes stop_codon:yes gene_type:complete